MKRTEPKTPAPTSPELDRALQVLMDLPYRDRCDALERLEKEARIKSEEARKASKAACPRQWSFFFTPAAKDTWNELREGSDVVLWNLHGKISNAGECKAAGWSDDEVRGGGMNYLVNMRGCNRAERRLPSIVGSSGGGNVYIKTERWTFGDKWTMEELKANADQAYSALEEFIFQNPTGGDVTKIILGQPNFSW